MNARRFAAALALVALTTLAYAPGLTSPFTRYDDPLYVKENVERMVPPGWEGLKLQFDSNRAWSGGFVEFFPLRDSVYWAIFQEYGLTPWPYHLASLIFHLITSLLVWLFLKQLGLPERGAWLGALIFALHPVHLESVVWIAGLKDPMYTMFMMAGLCAYASYRDRPSPWKYGVALLGLVFGFLVKSLIVAMPVLMLAMELFVGTRVKWSLIAARLAGPFVIAGLFMGSIMGIGRANGVFTGLHGGSVMSHTVLMVWSQVKYLKQTFFPTSFRLIYCFEPPTGWLDPRLWAGVALLVVVAAAAWRWRKEPLRLFLMAFYAIAILPVSNLVPFPAIMADRYLYAPTVGACGLLGLLAMQLRARTYFAVAAAAAVLLTSATASRAWVWQDEELLWEEPDLDPACVHDTSYPAAHAHILRYLSTKDKRVGLNALERAMITPGLSGVGQQLICTTLVGATQDALDLGGDDGQARALQFAQLATRICRTYPAAWNAAMSVSLHKNPKLAAGAAMKAWRLEKTPESESLMWLTLLELDDPAAAAQVTRVARKGDRYACEKIAQFSADVPRLAPQLGEAVFLCADVLSQPAPDPAK